jgi:hypothetical protein
VITLVLRHRFIFAPLLLSSVYKPFAGYKYVFRFYGLVGDYLPEERERLLKLSPSDAATQFIKLFSRRYFPIEDRKFWGDDPIRRLVELIPLDFHGLSQSNYEPAYQHMPPGQLLAETICIYPFDGEEGARLAVLDQFKKLLGEKAEELIKLLPAKGFRIEDIEKALKDSPYPGLLARCRWVFRRTGNRWLDTAYEAAEWNRENVDRLTRDWPAYREIDQQMKSFDSWLGHERNARFAEVIKYVRDKIPRTLMEVFAADEHESD